MSIGLVLMPFSALAEGDSITRREGYLLLWEGISRPAFDNNSSYTDLPEGHRGFTEITYGKSRGILPDESSFRPDDPLILRDALLWMYRTRNIRELPDMQESDLPGMINDYPAVKTDQSLDARVSRADLFQFVSILDQMLAKEVHEVSFYADDFQGNNTAFGETFDMYEITAAHRSMPHNTLVKVTNVDNGKVVVVRINDRGPYVHGRNMDLSLAAFEEIAPRGQGILRATFERLGDKDLVDRCEQRQRMYQRRITRDVHFFRGIPHTFSLGDQLILQSRKPFVVQRITFPDGKTLRIQDFVNPKEKYRFTPDTSGLYTIVAGDTMGRFREMRMNVSHCVLPE